MENVSQIIGIVLIIAGAISIVRSALVGNLTLGGLIIPIIIILIGAFIMRSHF